nr:hypothetical protein Iba_chr10cCG9240 [Ipomoea batatas]
MFSLEVFWINTTKNKFTSDFRFWITVKPEREHWLIYKALFDHTLPDRHDIFNRNLLEAQPKYPIKLGNYKRKTGFSCSLDKDLIFDKKVTKLNIILTEKARNGSRSIRD